MPSNYIYDSNSSTHLLSQSFEMLIPGANIKCSQKADNFKSYGDGVVDDSFFMGSFVTENIDTINVRDNNSCLLSIPVDGQFVVETSLKKSINVNRDNGLLILPGEKVIYHSPTKITNIYNMYVKMHNVNKILNNRYSIDNPKPEYIVLKRNEQFQAMAMFIESTLFNLRSFPSLRNTQFIKQSIQEIATSMIADIIASNLNAKLITNNKPDRFLVSKAESLISDECQALFTIQEVADKLFTTPRTIQLAFKKYREHSPMQFLRLQKLHRAHKKILSSNYTVKEIALDVGIYDLNRFSQYYTQVFGELPSTTMKRAQK